MKNIKGMKIKQWYLFLVNNYIYHRNHIRIQHEKKFSHGLWIAQRASEFDHIFSRNFLHGVYHVSWYTDMKSWWDVVSVKAGVDRTVAFKVFLESITISYCWVKYDSMWLTLFSSWMSEIPSVMARRISGCFLYINLNAGCSSSCFKTKVFW